MIKYNTMTVNDFITQASRDELLALNTFVVEKIKLKDKIASLCDISAFKVGDKVSFIGRRGRVITGTVEKVMKVNVDVMEDDDISGLFGSRYRVAARALTKLS